MQPIEPGLPSSHRVRRAVDVDVAAHRVDLAQAVEADLAAREPQDARQDPVAARDTARRAPGVQISPVGRRPTNTVLTGAPAPILARTMWRPRGVQWLPHCFACAVRSRSKRHRRRSAPAAGVGEASASASGIETRMPWHESCDAPLRRPAKNCLSSAPHSSVSTPPVTSVWWFSRGSANRFDDAAARAGFRIGRAEDEPPDARMHDRPGAHGARLERHVQIAVGQAVVARAALPRRAARRSRRGRVGSCVEIGALNPRPTIAPSATTTAPTGTSPLPSGFASQRERGAHELRVVVIPRSHFAS